MRQTASVGDVFAALYGAHRVADVWVQTETQAVTKGDPGWRGRLACARHVAAYTGVQFAALAALQHRRVKLAPRRLAAGVAISVATHYFADRRTPLRRLADRTGSGGLWALTCEGRDSGPGTGALELDQAWHVGWLYVAALVIGS